MGTRLKGFFERWNWQNLAVLYFQIGKKKCNTRGKIQKASRKLYDKNFFKILDFKITTRDISIYVRVCNCKNDEKKQQIRSIWTLPGSKLDQEIGKRRE